MNSKRAFWGTVFILGGIYFTLKHFGLLNFSVDWRVWSKFWPLLLILIGVRFLIPKESRSVNLVIIAVILLILVYSFYRGYQNRRLNSDDNGNFPGLPFTYHSGPKHFNSPKDDEDSDLDSSNGINNFDQGKGTLNQKFTIPVNPEIKSVALSVNGGAAEYTADVTHSDLFEAMIHTPNSNPYVMESSISGGLEKIKVSTGNHQNNDFNKESTNTFKIGLNPEILWSFDMNIGAGKIEYDFSGYKVENLNLNLGVSSAKIKLGRMVSHCEVSINSGLGSLNLKVPKSSACKVHLDGALNSNNLEGFQKVDDNTYQTANYSSSDHKIEIQFSGGISQFSISTY
jgi:hypothetical protein